MPDKVNGLHHVTMFAGDPRAHDAFYREALGLRRVKVTVNFDAPDVYHLYYGDRLGAPGTAWTSFPFGARAGRGKRGLGEAGETAFSVPPGSLAAWEERLSPFGATRREERFGEARLAFDGPDGESLAVVERDDPREPWAEVVPAEAAIRGFRGVTLALRDAGPTRAVLEAMGYEEAGREGSVLRMRVAGGNPADVIDLDIRPDAAPAQAGSGSTHHIAFSVDDDAAHERMRKIVTEAGMRPTPQIDRDYFHSIYFRTPGGVLFEIATNNPGFDRDEPAEALGTALKLPRQHEHLRAQLRRHLEPLDGVAA
jgi:glyoxalase family protein